MLGQIKPLSEGDVGARPALGAHIGPLACPPHALSALTVAQTSEPCKVTQTLQVYGRQCVCHCITQHSHNAETLYRSSS